MESLETRTERQTRFATTQPILTEDSNSVHLPNGLRPHNMSGTQILSSSAWDGLDGVAAVVGTIMVLAPLAAKQV